MINQIKVELSAEQAAALAQLCKRWRHDIARSISVDDAEADEMMSAIDMLWALRLLMPVIIHAERN